MASLLCMITMIGPGSGEQWTELSISMPDKSGSARFVKE